MAEPLAGSRGPLGALAVDLTKHLSFNVAGSTGFPPGDMDPTHIPPIHNDWGGQIQLTHARISAQYAGYPIRGHDGNTYIDFRVDGDSILPLIDQIGSQGLTSPNDRLYAVIPARDDETDDATPVTLLYQFPEGTYVEDGAAVSITVVEAPDSDGADPYDYQAGSATELVLYGFPTGR